MKKNISKVLLNTLITLGLLFSINNVSALTIKETVNSNDNYDTISEGSIIIGITKFEPNVVLTGKRISTATYNDVMFKYGTPNYDGVDIYYYLAGDWYKLDDENSVSVLEETDPMVEKLNKERNRIIRRIYKRVRRLKKAFPTIDTKEITEILNKKIELKRKDLKKLKVKNKNDK